MRMKMFCDGKEEYPLFSFDTREEAEAFVKKTRTGIALALYPSDRADVGMISHSPLWGRAALPEALRGVSYYLGVCAGWPIDFVSVFCENEKTVSLPLAPNPLADIPIKMHICKQMFENIPISLPFAAHSAVRFFDPCSFLLIESECLEAVDLSLAEGLSSSETLRIGLPICFAHLEDRVLRLRVCMRAHGEVQADDTMYMCALAYFYFTGRALKDVIYEAKGGAYRICGCSTAESIRKLSLMMNL